MMPSTVHIQTSELLASASQMLAHGLSRQTRSASATLQSLPDAPPLPPVPVPASTPTVMKKPSRWKLSFGKGNDEAAMSTRTDSQSSNPISNRTRHVTDVLMGLVSPSTLTSPPLPSPPSPPVSPPAIRSHSDKGWASAVAAAMACRITYRHTRWTGCPKHFEFLCVD